MEKPIKRRGFWGGLFVLVFGSTLLFFSSLAHGPNYTLTLTREVPSKLDSARLGKALHELSQWPTWTYSTKEVRALDPQGVDLPSEHQIAWEGALLRFNIEPPKKSWKKFQLFMEITEYQPTRLLVLKLHSDSSGRLTTLFDRLEWKIELIPQAQGTLLRGTVTAHTNHWRSRLFGAIARRILLNQVFYPDLIKLATLKN